MVDSIEDLREGFYLKDERIRSPVIQLCYVCKEGKKWFAYTPGGGPTLEQFKHEIGTHTLALNPLFLEGPIDPEDYLKQHNTNLKTFVSSKLEQLAQSKKPLIPPKLAVITNSRPVSPFTDPHFYDDYELGNR